MLIKTAQCIYLFTKQAASEGLYFLRKLYLKNLNIKNKNNREKKKKKKKKKCKLSIYFTLKLKTRQISQFIQANRELRDWNKILLCLPLV